MAHVVDEFDRADSTNNLGASYEAAPPSGFTQPSISGGAALVSGNDYWPARRTDSFAADQWAELGLRGAIPSGSGAEVLLRHTGSGLGEVYTYIMAADSTNGWEIARVVNGSMTSLVSGTLPSGTWGAGDTIRGEVVGSTLRMYRNGVQLGTTTDSNVTSGAPGFGAWGHGGNVTVERATFSDEFGGGSAIGPISYHYTQQGIR